MARARTHQPREAVVRISGHDNVKSCINALDQSYVESVDTDRAMRVAMAERQILPLLAEIPQQDGVGRGIPGAHDRRFTFDVRCLVQLRQAVLASMRRVRAMTLQSPALC